MHATGTPTQLSPTMTADELAGLLHIKSATLRRRRLALEAQGMPRPLASPGFVWSRRLVLAWIDGSLWAAADDGPVDQVSIARALLEQRVS